jgi:hypothetical protein
MGKLGKRPKYLYEDRVKRDRHLDKQQRYYRKQGTASERLWEKYSLKAEAEYMKACQYDSQMNRSDDFHD